MYLHPLDTKLAYLSAMSDINPANDESAPSEARKFPSAEMKMRIQKRKRRVSRPSRSAAEEPAELSVDPAPQEERSGKRPHAEEETSEPPSSLAVSPPAPAPSSPLIPSSPPFPQSYTSREVRGNDGSRMKIYTPLWRVPADGADIEDPKVSMELMRGMMIPSSELKFGRESMEEAARNLSRALILSANHADMLVRRAVLMKKNEKDFLKEKEAILLGAEEAKKDRERLQAQVAEMEKSFQTAQSENENLKIELENFKAEQERLKN